MSEKDLALLEVHLSYWASWPSISALIPLERGAPKATGVGIFTAARGGQHILPEGLLVTIQKGLREFLDKIPMKPHKERTIPLPVREEVLSLGDRYGVRPKPDEYIDGPVLQIDSAEYMAVWTHKALDNIIHDFVDLLKDLPAGALRRCDNCQKVFANLSAKKKVYCTPSCSFKFLARKRRENLKKHPKEYRKYLKDQREAMHRVYEERVKKDHPNAKVRRHPRKRQKKDTQ
jgi:DNA-directed RNA polymerase subunit RPC12/RpoP